MSSNMIHNLIRIKSIFGAIRAFVLNILLLTFFNIIYWTLLNFFNNSLTLLDPVLKMILRWWIYTRFWGLKWSLIWVKRIWLGKNLWLLLLNIVVCWYWSWLIFTEYANFSILWIRVWAFSALPFINCVWTQVKFVCFFWSILRANNTIFSVHWIRFGACFTFPLLDRNLLCALHFYLNLILINLINFLRY